jgi:crotonobetainyl-CoA:carnitine CoA-transferase CaiB-like acyl-CoA transferase
MTAALEGLSVVDLSTTLSGAHASQLFSDFGASVTMVEPVTGHPLRGQPAFPFWARGKKSIGLDLKDPADNETARGLAGQADVLIETWRPGVAERLGLGYEELSRLNRRLVYGSITGFGRTGPLSQVAGYEGIVMAKIGAYGALRLTDADRPSVAVTPAASFSASQTLVQGVLAALYERESSGVGQRVDTTLVQAQSTHDCWNWITRLVASRYPEAFTAVPRVDDKRKVPNGPLSFRLLVALSKDGRWMQFSQTSERLWVAFMESLGLGWMLQDPEWANAPSDPDIDKREALWERMLAAVRTRTLEEWWREFEAHPDVFAEVCRRGTELLHHPQLLHAGQVVEVEDPGLGKVRQLGPLVKMSRTAARVDSPAPVLNRDEDELRALSRLAPATTDLAPPVMGGATAPLQGVTVVELGTFYAGPYGATVLAELGARVVKLELIEGDPMRWITGFPEVGGLKVLAGKESVAVDVAAPEGREIVYELSKKADLVLSSFRAGAAERLGLDAEELLARNPDLVYLNAPGFGIDGPYGKRPAYAPTIGVGAGMAGRNLGSTLVQRPDLSDEEVKVLSLRVGAAAMSGANPDAISALGVASGLLLGLLARRRGAPGQSMLTTMLNTMGHCLAEDLVEYEGRRPLAEVDGEILGLDGLYRMYEASDGWIFLAVRSDRDWKRLSAALGDRVDDLAADAQLATREGRRSGDPRIAHRLAEVFATRSASDWETELLAAGVACVEVAPGPSEATMWEGDDSIGRQLGLIVDQEHPILGSHPRIRSLVDFSRSATLAPATPSLGQHTQAVLCELGYTENRIAELRGRGVVA